MSSLVITGTVSGAEIAPVVKSPEEEQFAQIQDALTVLPPINHYLAKTQNVTKRYENVFRPLSETETKERIKNAKEKAIKFYAEIFGVNLSEIEKYSENFTTEQYLTWVAKETINNGKYTFASNEEELFDSEFDPDDGIFVRLNDPYFDTMIVHETGHAVHRKYDALHKLSEFHGGSLSDAVSVFFETLYTKWTNDPTLNLVRLSDFYTITFKQSFRKKIRERGNQDRIAKKAIYEEVQNLYNLEEPSNNGFPQHVIRGYEPKYRWEDEENQNLADEAKTRNCSEESYRKYIFENFPKLKFVYEMWEEQLEEWGITKLPFNTPVPGICYVSEYLRKSLEDYLGVEQRYVDFSIINSYIHYVPHVYRTLRLASELKSGKDVVNALDNIVRNVPKIMTKNELDDFIKLLGLK